MSYPKAKKPKFKVNSSSALFMQSLNQARFNISAPRNGNQPEVIPGLTYQEDKQQQYDKRKRTVKSFLLSTLTNPSFEDNN